MGLVHSKFPDFQMQQSSPGSYRQQPQQHPVRVARYVGMYVSPFPLAGHLKHYCQNWASIIIIIRIIDGLSTYFRTKR